MGQIWLAQQQRGACVEFLAGVNERIPTEAYARSIDCDTMVVPVSQVSFVNGSRADVLEIARLAHDRGALVFLDGYQDCGTRPVDVKAMDVDFYVTGTLKYLLGPPGLAFLYVRESLIEQLSPSITSWMAQREVFAFNPKRLDPAPSARRFEGGSPPIPNLYMALPALRMLRQIGLDKVAAQIRTLTMAFREGLSELSIDAKTPADSIGPLVVVRCRDADQLVAKLQARNILVSARRDGLRFSFHVYNTLEDVREALKALECNLGLVVRTS
jgi:selenocysteine lyase/cysteine desulfurase